MSQKKKLSRGALAVLIGLTSAFAAQEELSLSDLLNVKLETGSFLELDLRNAPLSMTMIKGKQIKSSGVRNLNEALEVYVPGFQYMNNKWNGTIWAMRGVTGDRNDKIIVLINGVKQNLQSFHGFATETDLGLLGDIERIEVLRGPAGLVYGAGAIAGVVNIVTTAIPEDDGGSISVKYESSLNEDNSGRTIQGNYSKVFDESSVVVNFGQHVSDGIGDNLSRIYGISEHSERPAEGYQSGGSYGETPGNFLGSVDFRTENLQVYSRFTRQHTNMGPLFLPTPFADSPHLTSTKLNAESYSTDDTAPNMNGWNAATRSHLRENLLAFAKYEIPVGDDKIVLDGSVDIASNRHLIDGFDMKGTSSTGTVDSTGAFSSTSNGDYSEGFINATSGEMRREVGAKYLLKSVEDLQVALGAQYTWIQIGPDLQANNPSGFWFNNNDTTEYTNQAYYLESFYDVNDMVGLSLGARWDKHTQTDGVLSPKAAVVLRPNEDHTIKLIAQTSSNNADGLTYAAADKAAENKVWGYEKAAEVTDKTLSSEEAEKLLGNLLAPASPLDPEKSTSYELATYHTLGNTNLEFSASYNQMTDLVLYNAALQQSQNAGEYTALTIEAAANYEGEGYTLGSNLAYQVPLDFDKKPISFTRPVFEAKWSDTQGQYVPTAIADSVVTEQSKVMTEQVSIDGNFFNSIHTLTAKAFVDVELGENATFHTDVRYFGGLWNRDGLINAGAQEITDRARANGSIQPWETIDLPEDDSFKLDNLNNMIKWNMALLFDLNDDWSMGVYGYNLLGDPMSKHAGRTQQITAFRQAEVFTVDVRTFAVQLARNF